MGIPLQDVYSSSAVVLTPTPDGQVHLVILDLLKYYCQNILFFTFDSSSQDGVLNNSLVIKSLPHRVLKEVAYGGHNLYEPHHKKNVTSDDEFAYTHHHVVYKMPQSHQYNDFSKLLDNYMRI